MTTLLNLKDHTQHLEQLALWHHQQWSYLNPDESLHQRMLRMQCCLNDELIPSTFIAADRELLGSAALVVNDMETNPQLSPWLASVYVAPQHRKKGIGTQLVLHAMAQAKHGGINTLYLFTPDMAPFYRNLGWRTLSNEIYHGHKVTVMHAVLPELEI
jgi:N-acetylglutamate synthase-like GNAT family acetyltransferase